MASIYRNNLVQRLHNEMSDTDITKAQIKDVVEMLFLEIGGILATSDDEVIISNFGTFKTNKVAERVSKDFNGDPITVPAHKRVSFKTSKHLKGRLTNG